MIDYVLIPDLRCRRCGETTAKDIRQTCINEEPHGRIYTVGSHFDLPEDVRGFVDAGYLPTRPNVVVGERLRVLEVWYCGHCGTDSLCVWFFENKVLVEPRLVETLPMIFSEVDFVTDDLSPDWPQEALLGIYPDRAETIEFMTLEECIEAFVSGRMIEDSD